MGKYTEAKSKFVKEKIKTANFEDRQYIDDLLFLEDCALGKAGNNFGGAMNFHSLKSEHEKEYIEILKELAPEKLDKFLKEKGKSEKEERETEKYFENEEEQERKDWIKAGGK